MVRELRDTVLRMLNRSNAYKRVFMEDGKLTVNGADVLRDLAKFCKAHEPTTRVSPVTRMVDPLAMAQTEGRREVWLRLMWHLKMDEADLINMKEDDHDD